MQKYKIIKENSKFSLSLEEIKKFLRVTQDHDDKIISNMSIAAQDIAEKYTNFCLSLKEITLEVSPISNKIIVPLTPISKIESIKFKYDEDFKNIDESLYDISPFHDYIIIDSSLRGKILQINYTAGFDNYEKIPQAIIQGLMLHIAEMYDKQIISTILPNSVKLLYSPFMSYKI
ncbi:MAG: hypothetical protein K0R02_931 [Rickettsiaceae bacterium]|jgi:uncharacterized phiE125 gp8 family phage protein|nr:hypothetical protein [Rickettsiaceae bacterium]